MEVNRESMDEISAALPIHLMNFFPQRIPLTFEQIALLANILMFNCSGGGHPLVHWSGFRGNVYLHCIFPKGAVWLNTSENCIFPQFFFVSLTLHAQAATQHSVPRLRWPTTASFWVRNMGFRLFNMISMTWISDEI